MDYQQSIQNVNIAEAFYFHVCDLAETDDVVAYALQTLHTAKAVHIQQFGALTRINGEWI